MIEATPMTDKLEPTQALAPCGNCNAPARWVENAWRVKCTRPSCGVEGGKFEQRHVAIAAWNTRTTHSGEGRSDYVEAFDILVDVQSALVLTAEHSHGASVASFVDSSAQYARLNKFLHDRQHNDPREGRSYGAGKDAVKSVMAILWRREQYNGVGPDYHNYRSGSKWDMGGRVEGYEKEAREIVAALTPQGDGEVERLREMALTDDPDWIAAGIPDDAIEAGMQVFRQVDADNENYVAGETTDWDEGMIVAAIFKAVARAALRALPSGKDEG